MLERFFDAPRWQQAVIACLFSVLITVLTFWLLVPSSDEQAQMVESSAPRTKPVKPNLGKVLDDLPPLFEDFSSDAYVSHHIEPQIDTSDNASKAVAPVAQDVLPSPSDTAVAFAPTPEAPLQPAKPSHSISIVIDDVGYDLHAVDTLINLPFPVAMAVLPLSPHAKEAAEKVYQAGEVLMLHMPMEPERAQGRIRMDASFLRANMKEYEVRRTLRQAVQMVPHAMGVNNHMGSLLTAMEQPMQWVMDEVAKQHMFFIDSRTSVASVAAKQAQAFGISHASRNVFLDHSVKKEDLQASWKRLMHCVETQKHCIIIGHPHRETLDFLLHDIPKEQQKLIQPLTDVLALQSL